MTKNHSFDKNISYYTSFLRYISRHDRQSSNSLRHFCNMSWKWVDDKKSDRLTSFFPRKVEKIDVSIDKVPRLPITTPVESQNTTEVQFHLVDDLDRHIVVNEKITLRIMRRPILSPSRNTNYDLYVLIGETHVSTKFNEILEQLVYTIPIRCPWRTL